MFPRRADFLTPVLDTQTAPDDLGQWMEFDIPIELVQRWLDHPEQNSGLYIKSMNEKTEWGDHVYFYSSEHSSGKGPQLVIEGTPGKPGIETAKQVRKKRKHMFPPSDAAFDKWLEHEYVEKFMDDLMKIQEFIKQGRDDEAMFNLVKSLHMNHELFLYFQSWYNTPRWSLYMEQAAPIPLAKIFVKSWQLFQAASSLSKRDYQ